MSSSEAFVPAAQATAAVAVHLIGEPADAALAALAPAAVTFARASGFKGQAGRMLVIADADGRPDAVLLGLGDPARASVQALRSLPSRLPPGDYALAALPDGWSGEAAALAWAQGAYAFDRYKHSQAQPARGGARLEVGDGVDLERVQRTAATLTMCRDMVNTPAADMGPAHIEAAAREIAAAHGATATSVVGDALLEANYPAVHAVGRAAAPHHAPRMIELAWTGPGATTDSPLLAIVGKGVAFDSGGLDIKPSAGMRWMKKDMGGAAHALALAQMVMDAGLPVRLAVLVPAVENAISADAMRPGDVLATRAGLSVEVGNTDAEGRLILADALTRAGELAPDLTLDFATLTGAARVALGPEVIPFFTADEALAAELTDAARAVDDPLWRMPLWAGYEEALNSDIADLKNDGEGWAQAGAVVAALFLQRFAPASGVWAHFDLYAWNARSQPGRPQGGEAQAIRAVFAVLSRRYGASLRAVQA